MIAPLAGAGLYGRQKFIFIMSNEASIHGQHAVSTGHDVHGHEEHHHHETFITKYVFSQDHKMISKQFLVTGIIWAIIGGLFSVLFRLQLGYPGSDFPDS